MRSRTKIVVLVCLASWASILLPACSQQQTGSTANMVAAQEAKENVAELRAAMAKIEPFFKRMGKPDKSDWLASHREAGQTFAEYLEGSPTKPSSERNKIFILPLGRFNSQQKKIIDITTAYLGAFYHLTVSPMAPQAIRRPLGTKNSRRNPVTHSEQVRTGYLLDDVLKPLLPRDAAALIAFTADDLYPDDSMNYVFGQASLDQRIGIWSLARLDDNADHQKFLLRTLKIAAHETGHMFSMRHCTKYECLMSGTNHLDETDRRPIDACPECTAKIWWLTGVNQVNRYIRLENFCRSNGLPKQADEFHRKAAAVR